MSSSSSKMLSNMKEAGQSIMSKRRLWRDRLIVILLSVFAAVAVSDTVLWLNFLLSVLVGAALFYLYIALRRTDKGVNDNESSNGSPVLSGGDSGDPASA